MSVDPAMQRFVLALDMGEQAVRRHAYALSVSAQTQMAARQGVPAPSVPVGPVAAPGAGQSPIRWPAGANPASPLGGQQGANAGQQPGSPQFGGFQLTAAINANTAAITANTIALQKGGAGRGTAGGGGKPGGPADPKEFNLEKATREFASFGSMLESMSARGRASILSLVASADPSMFSTFNAKIEAVSIAVGEVFVPYVDVASRALHNFAGWFRSLDDGTKEWIGTLGVSAVAIAGLGGALLTTGAWFVSSYNIIRTSTVAQWTWIGATRAATAAKWLLAASIRGVSTALMFMFANPVGLAITAVAGLAAGVAYLAGAFDKLGTSAGGAGNQVRNTSQIPGMGGGPLPGQPQTLAQAIAPLPQAQRNQLLTPGQNAAATKSVLDQIEKDTQTMLATQQQSLPAALAPAQQEADKKNAILKRFAEQGNSSIDLVKRQFERDLNIFQRLQAMNAGERDAEYKQRLEVMAEIMRRDAITEAAKSKVVISQQEAASSIVFGNDNKSVDFSPVAPKTTAANTNAPNPNLPSIPELQSRLNAVAEARRILGQNPGPGGGQQQGGNPYTENVKLPVNARYTDVMGFLENVQTQALNIGDADAQNQKDILQGQLNRLADMKQLLGDINGNLKGLQDGVAKLKWWR